MNRKLSVLAALFIFLISSPVYSQLINGRVLTETGIAAPAVSVNFKNKANLVVTNADGSFKIMAAKLPDTLVFSAVGYQSYNVRVTDKTVKDVNFEVVLLKERQSLSDVVVVGYATSKRREVTGSVSSITAPTLTMSAPGSTLAGSVAGVSIISDSKMTSPVRIRGISSMSGGPKVSGEKNLLVQSGRKISFADSISGSGSEKPYQSRLITAGEINDFNKWKMWEDFTETDFKDWSHQWELFPKQRYCVQLQNENRAPVAGEKVYLLNKTTHDTLWTAVTDNTGKAELWAGMNDKAFDRSAELQLLSPRFQTIDHPSLFENGVNRATVKVACDDKKAVEIAFVVDATGSMGDEIEFLKLELEDVLTKTFESFADRNLRAAAVFYRDRADEYVERHIDFNNDLLKVLNFIKLQKADGGGDTPEAVEVALSAAIDSLSWSAASTKILFMVLDAPPHAGNESKIFALIQAAAAKGIRVIPIVCSGADKGTEFLMRSIALATNGDYVFLTDHSGIGGAHLKPTTDVYEVELLNTLMQRLIRQMVFMQPCASPAVAFPQPRMPGNILKVKVTPNPTRGELRINANKGLKDLFLTDFTGKILLRLNCGSKIETWSADLSQYPAGMYFVKYISADNEWGAEKIVVVR